MLWCVRPVTSSNWEANLLRFEEQLARDEQRSQQENEEKILLNNKVDSLVFLEDIQFSHSWNLSSDANSSIPSRKWTPELANDSKRNNSNVLFTRTIYSHQVQHITREINQELDQEKVNFNLKTIQILYFKAHVVMYMKDIQINRNVFTYECCCVLFKVQCLLSNFEKMKLFTRLTEKHPIK